MFEERYIDKKFDKLRLDVLLVKLDIFDSRQKSIAEIMSGNIFLNEIKTTKSGTIVRSGSTLKVKLRQHNWVSRGGIKLEHVVKVLKLNINNKTCVDIGASTGGFTDVLLHYGAKKVFCFDVGYGQLAWKLRDNKKVINSEKFNARFLNYNDILCKVDLVVCDVSFISVKKILPSIFDVLQNKGHALILIKPQFESEKKFVLKGGIVKDSKIHIKVCEDIKKTIIENYCIQSFKIVESPIKGQKGNREFFIYFKI